MLRTRRHAAVLALLAALACALLPGFLDPVAAQGSTAPGLGGVAFGDATPAAANAFCGPDFGGAYSYQVDGAASGAYAGTFTGAGSVRLGAADAFGRQALVGLNGTFTIQAADGAVVTGSAWFDPAVGPNPDTGRCEDTWDGFRAAAGTDSLRYEATIATADGRTCTAQGSARLQLSSNLSTLADGFTQSFLNDLAAPVAACAGGGDTTAPVLSLPGTVVVEATGPGGAAVPFTAAATDNVDGPLTPACSHASGATFPLGATTVACSATDAAGNTGTASFVVTVVDTTAPVITAPDVVVEATSPAGAAVPFAGGVSAVDLVSGAVAVGCDRASGAAFPIGMTTVTCTAADAAGNVATQPFLVTVQTTLGPTDKEQCKDDGWRTFNNPFFSSQGDCVSFVATGG